jgi:hypothetical protein
MFQATVLMQQLTQFLSCNRRNPSGTRTGLKEAPFSASGKNLKKAASRGYRSNESTDLDSDAGLMSTSGSDKETTSSRRSAQRYSNARPQGFHGPPGLDARMVANLRIKSLVRVEKEKAFIQRQVPLFGNL